MAAQLRRQTSVLVTVVLGVILTAAGAIAQCDGDCDGDAAVTVDEIVKGVNIALGNLVIAQCPLFDANHDDEVTVEELVRAINHALDGCPLMPTPSATIPAPTATESASPTAPLAETATQTPTAIPSSTTTPAITASATETAVPTQMEQTPSVTPSQTITATASEAPATATASPTATAGSVSECGNGFLEAGESCDSCAADCVIHPCTAAGRQKFEVVYTASRPATSLTVFVGYRSEVVSLPGSANQATVGQRITERPSGTFIINDKDYQLITVLGGTNQKATGKLYAVDFDVCQGASSPTADDFGCAVNCSDGNGPIMPCDCGLVLR